MSGAIIPDDWNGTSFSCIKVYWPNSEKWKALLLGQITEPEFTEFWDKNTGDVDAAIAAVAQAEETTLISQWLQDCETVIDLPGFKVTTTQGNALQASFWEYIDFNTVVYDNLSSGWQSEGIPVPYHRPYLEDKAGRWLYTLEMGADSPSLMSVAVRSGVGGTILGLMTGPGTKQTLTFTFDFALQDLSLFPYIWTLEASNLNINAYNCFFTGTYLGP